MNALSRETFDRISEQDAFESSQVFFACMFSDNAILSDCGLEPDDFAEHVHQIVFKEAVALNKGGQHVNAVSLKPFLPKVFKVKDEREQMREADFTPAEYLSKLTIMGASPQTRSRLVGSIQIIKGVSLSRQLAREAQVALNIAEDGFGLLVLGDEIEKVENRLKEMRARFIETTAITSPGSQYLSAFSASSKRDGVVGVPIGLPEIASVLSEPVFEAGNLYGLLSSSGEGKSSLTMQLIYHALLQGHPVLFLSYDQSAAQCIRQMIAQIHGIDVRQQREPARLMSQSEQETCVRFATWIDHQPLEIIKCQRQGVTQLVAYARRFMKQRVNGKTPFIVIDHIGKVKPHDPKLSADRISGDVTVELKSLADETQSSVLVLNQRNSFGTRRDNPRPIAADLYGGEGARADYDAVMYLYRSEKYKAERMKIAATDSDWKKINKVFASDAEALAEIGSIKVRFGDPTITENVKFEARFTRYVSLTPTRPAELPL